MNKWFMKGEENRLRWDREEVWREECIKESKNNEEERIWIEEDCEENIEDGRKWKDCKMIRREV